MRFLFRDFMLFRFHICIIPFIIGCIDYSGPIEVGECAVERPSDYTCYLEIENYCGEENAIFERDSCNLAEDSFDFCYNECVKAFSSDVNAHKLCSDVQVIEEECDGYNACIYNKDEINKEIQYDICNPPEDTPPDEEVWGDDEWEIYCHGTLPPEAPAGFEHDFNPNEISYWQTFKENGAWSDPMAGSVTITACGYKLESPYNGDNGPDGRCQYFCEETISTKEGCDNSEESCDDAVQIASDNCNSFVAGSLCDGQNSNDNQEYSYSDLFSSSFSLFPILTINNQQFSVPLQGSLTYSHYHCVPGVTTCPIIFSSIHASSSQSLSGRYMLSSGEFVSFNIDSLEVSVERRISGSMDPSTQQFVLPAIPISVSGNVQFEKSVPPAPFRTTVYNSAPVDGSIDTSGAVQLTGNFEVAPGISISF